MKNLLITLAILTSQLSFSQEVLSYKFIEYDNQFKKLHKLYKLAEDRDIVIYKNKIVIEDTENENPQVFKIKSRKNEDWGYWFYLTGVDNKEYVMEFSGDGYQARIYHNIKDMTFFYFE